MLQAQVVSVVMSAVTSMTSLPQATAAARARRRAGRAAARARVAAARAGRAARPCRRSRWSPRAAARPAVPVAVAAAAARLERCQPQGQWRRPPEQACPSGRRASLLVDYSYRLSSRLLFDVVASIVEAEPDRNRDSGPQLLGNDRPLFQDPFLKQQVAGAKLQAEVFWRAPSCRRSRASGTPAPRRREGIASPARTPTSVILGPTTL